MRLSKLEIEKIKLASKLFKIKGDIFLFGSRVDDNKKGGDVDLFIEAKEELNFADQIKFLTKLEIMGIQRKVDLIVKNPNSSHKEIYNIAKKEGIKL
jgi:predicted nucleotidyltransferase